MQINRWLHTSNSLWGISPHCDMFRERIDQKLPFIAKNNKIVLIVQWSVNYYFFALNSPLFHKSLSEEKGTGNSKGFTSKRKNAIIIPFNEFQ